jgi:23S rRNA-/tRNA-specific pseudouridylate synthase
MNMAAQLPSTLKAKKTGCTSSSSNRPVHRSYSVLPGLCTYEIASNSLTTQLYHFEFSFYIKKRSSGLKLNEIIRTEYKYIANENKLDMEETTRINNLFINGQVSVNRCLCSDSCHPAKLNDFIQITYQRKEPNIRLSNLPAQCKSIQDLLISSVVYKDAGLIILNKASGILVHPSGEFFHLTIIGLIKAGAYGSINSKESELIYPVHRLDKPTSGCLICCFNSSTANSFTQLFQSNYIKKIYVALVHGNIEINSSNNLSSEQLSHKHQNDKTALTYFIPVQYLAEKNCTLIYAIPISGRTHQIRKHIQVNFNTHIINDQLYGSSITSAHTHINLDSDAIALHCAALAIPAGNLHNSATLNSIVLFAEKNESSSYDLVVSAPPPWYTQFSQLQTFNSTQLAQSLQQAISAVHIKPASTGI